MPFDVITSPAPNAAAIRKYEPHSSPFIEETMERRIRKIIQIAAQNNIDCLVLGAFGCGVFGNDIEFVAKTFKKILIDEGFEMYFKFIEFAVYDKNPNSYMIFKNLFE